LLLLLLFPEGIYKNFFPTKPKPNAEGVIVEPTETPLGRRRKLQRHVVPLLEEEELAELAKEFASKIPENEMSVCTCFFYPFSLILLLVPGLPSRGSGDLFILIHC
jgi:hypothetical protein